MRLSVQLHHSRDLRGGVEAAVAAEQLGYDTVWVPEAYGSEAVSMLSFIAARTSSIRLGAGVLQIPARTPANAAMCAMTLDELSGGRVVLGFGTSGPQVAEGWHGMPFEKPLARTREYIEIVRRIIRRDEPLRFDGQIYQVPIDRGPRTAPALKSSMHPHRPEIPIYLAANGPRNVALAAEIADGWLPSMYVPDHDDVVAEALAEGTARRDPARPPTRGGHPSSKPSSGRTSTPAETPPGRISPSTSVAWAHAQQNFYKDIVTRYGYGEAADRVQDLYLSGSKEEAGKAIPDELVDKLALVGPPEVVGDRLQAWRNSRVTELGIRTNDVRMLEAVRKALDDL